MVDKCFRCGCEIGGFHIRFSKATEDFVFFFCCKKCFKQFLVERGYFLERDSSVGLWRRFVFMLRTDAIIVFLFVLVHKILRILFTCYNN